MRFAVARQQGLTEQLANLIDEGFETSELAARHKTAIQFADAYLGAAGAPASDVQATIMQHFSAAEIAEMGIGLALFHGFSKLLIAVGAEPIEMDVTMLRTPGSASA